MSNRHTPGPWKFGYTDNLEYPIIIGADDEIVCVMRGGVSTKDGNLLAMGPELLEALIGLDEAYCRAGEKLTRDERTEDRKRLIAARAAIAKATGGAA